MMRMKLFQEYRGLRKENYILFVGRIMTAFGSMIYPMMTLILSQKLNISAGNIAVVMVIYSMISIPMNLLGGRLADRHSKKNIIVLCNSTAVLCFLICALLPLTYFSMILYAFGALVLQMENSSYSALIADITPTKDRTRAYSLSYLGINLGMVLSPTIAGFLFQNYLWLMFLINGFTIAGTTALIYFFLRDISGRQEAVSAYETADDNASVLSILKQNKIILLFFMIMALDSAVYNQSGYLMPLDLGKAHGDAGALIYGTVTSLNCIIVVIFTPLITRVFRKINDCQKMLVADSLMVFSYILFRLLLGTIPSYYVAMTIFTWGEIFRTLACDPYLTRRVPQSHRGRLLSLNSAGIAVTYAVVALCVGKIYDAAGSSVAWVFTIAVGLTAVALEVWLMKKDRNTYPDFYKKQG